jgi:sugar phosphate isomerase/epimerase
MTHAFPKLAVCNFIDDADRLKELAMRHGFDGIDWTFSPADLPVSQAEASSTARVIAGLHPLEVRYHCFLPNSDVGDEDDGARERAIEVFQRVFRLVSKLGGRFATIHVGLGRDSTEGLSWRRTIDGLRELLSFAGGLGVKVCLENLDWGWTARPQLFEKLIRKTGSWATLDIGHARVSESVTSQLYRLEDFTTPHPERFLNAHIYHEETETGHSPPARLDQIADRLRLLRKLPLCDWWVLEVREEAGVLQTLEIVRDFKRSESEQAAGIGAS